MRLRTYLIILLAGNAGCHDLTSDPGLPAGTPDPAIYQTLSGALGLRTAALFQVTQALPNYLKESGLLSDELQDWNTGAPLHPLPSTTSDLPDPLDERILSEGTTGGLASYMALQNIRGAANVALGALAAYDTAIADRPTQRVMRGELYALQGYAEILLAELFCSGVPLSTLDFPRDFTYAPSSTTEQVLQDAETKLDSALQLAAGTDSIVNLARVLQGRALLDRGQYTAAASAVATVPEDFQYQMSWSTMGVGGTPFQTLSEGATISDREGENGLPYRSEADVRTATTVIYLPNEYLNNADTLFVPTKYTVLHGNGYTNMVIASGIEAQLIRAEAQLQPAENPSRPWLTTLNDIRATVGLDALADPGAGLTSADAAAARVALLFRERAYWLFVTGHRQGDLRRVLRQYNRYQQFRSNAQVYPNGPYTAPGTGRYGTDVNAPIPIDEYANPNYHGCLDRNA